MRKTILVAMVAAFGGFCLASATAFASLRYNIWKASTDQFRLGYVIGYLDAVALAQRKDYRAAVPITPGKDYEPWVRGVDKYFEDPANQSKTLPDAMSAYGIELRMELLRESGRQRMGLRPSPKPSAQP